jgi:hypothetical protein
MLDYSKINLSVRAVESRDPVAEAREIIEAEQSANARYWDALVLVREHEIAERKRASNDLRLSLAANDPAWGDA